MSINKVIIAGNVTRDPELEALPSGTSVLRLGVAVNERKKNAKTGEWEDSPVFVDCVMFGTRAAAVSPYIAKGAKVAIEGRLRWSSWEERDTGKKRSKLDVIVDELELMTAREAPAPKPQPAKRYVQPDVYADEDIPF